MEGAGGGGGVESRRMKKNERENFAEKVVHTEQPRKKILASKFRSILQKS